MAEVELERVSKFFPPTRAAQKNNHGAVAAVNDLTLQVAEGELLVLVGPSGCGKTTTLRLIAGLETPDRGTIRLGGRPVNGLPPRERNVAMVFQHYALYPHWTVYKNLAFGLELQQGGNWFRRGCLWIASPAQARQAAAERSKIKERVHQTAQMLGIEALLDRKPAQLSGGERQRVALGRALVREPAAFLLDEPLSNLDGPLRVELRREIKELHRRLGVSLVYVTHDQGEAIALGDRIGVMHRGQLQQVGPPREIYQRPKNRFVAGFFGSAGMNFLEGTFLSTSRGIQFQCPGVAIPLASSAGVELSSRLAREETGSNLSQETLAAFLHRPVVLGIRPEDVILRDTGSGAADLEDLGPETTARARVSLVECLGDVALVHLELEPRQDASDEMESSPISRLPSTAFSPKLVSKTEARTTARRGDVRDVVLRRASFHWFDGQTGERLACSPSAPAFPA